MHGLVEQIVAFHFDFIAEDFDIAESVHSVQTSRPFLMIASE
jgi:hypothetical protein